MDIGAVFGNRAAAQPTAQSVRRQRQIKRQKCRFFFIRPKDLDLRLTGIRRCGEFNERFIELL